MRVRRAFRKAARRWLRRQSRRLVLPLKHGDRTDHVRAPAAWMARAGGECWPSRA
jgi:hypothetical protein